MNDVLPHPLHKTDALARAGHVLHAFQSLHGDFPLLYALCLIEIACQEGLSLTDLAQKVNAPLSTVSRAIGALSNARQRGEPYGLVTVIPSETERRRKHLHLSPKGHAVIQSVINAIDS